MILLQLVLIILIPCLQLLLDQRHLLLLALQELVNLVLALSKVAILLLQVVQLVLHILVGDRQLRVLFVNELGYMNHIQKLFIALNKLITNLGFLFDLLLHFGLYLLPLLRYQGM